MLEKLAVTMPETETNPHVVRVGWSVDRANLQVSEAKWLLDPSSHTTHKGTKLNLPMQLHVPLISMLEDANRQL